MIPVGQPVLGSIGKGLDIVASISEQSPWETIKQTKSLYGEFSKENIATSLASYRKLVADVNSVDLTKPTKLFASISSASEAIGTSLAKFQKLQEQSRAPASEVEAIFAKYKAEDSTLNDLVQKASLISAERRLLAEKLDQVIRVLASTTSEASTLAERIDALNHSITDVQDQVDHPAIAAAAGMGRLLRERLDYYHYVMEKAYEYYAATPYPGNRRVSGTAESVRDLISKSSGEPNQAAAAYVTAYTSDILDVESQIMRQLVLRGADHQKPMTIVLSLEERNAVNKMLDPSETAPHDLFIPLEDRGDLLPSHLEARLVDAKVASFETRRGSPVASGAGGWRRAL